MYYSELKYCVFCFASRKLNVDLFNMAFGCIYVCDNKDWNQTLRKHKTFIRILQI